MSNPLEDFMHSASSLHAFTHPDFDKLPVAYGFFGRRGGHSTGLYDSLNCGFGSDDETALVAKNRATCANSIGITPEAVASVYQVHSADIVTITNLDQLHKPRLQADGLVTRLPDIGLSILTADCTPLLFCDPDHHVIGACHAGWRGAAKGVIQNTITAMKALGARHETIHCVIGPTIAQASYQIGQDMYQEVCQLAPQAAPYFRPDPQKGDKYLFNLPAFAAHCASQAGLNHIYDLGLDTYDESELFFSHRRATHNNQTDTGRQMALIAHPPH